MRFWCGIGTRVTRLLIPNKAPFFSTMVEEMIAVAAKTGCAVSVF